MCFFSAPQMLKLTRTGLAGQETMALIRSFQNKTPLQEGQGTQGNFLSLFFLASLYGDKCTSQSLKNWIQVTAQSLLSSETQGRPGTFSEPRRCLQGQDSVSPHVVTSMVIQARSLGLP